MRSGIISAMMVMMRVTNITSSMTLATTSTLSMTITMTSTIAIVITTCAFESFRPTPERNVPEF